MKKALQFQRILIYTKKVWSWLSFILMKVVERPNWKINDTIPHTRIDMGYGYAERDLPQVSIRKWVLFRIVHPVEKTSTFSLADLRKTLSQYVMPDGSAEWLYKSKHFSWTDNTHRGIAKEKKRISNLQTPPNSERTSDFWGTFGELKLKRRYRYL